jgi:hypothetical protein
MCPQLLFPENPFQAWDMIKALVLLILITFMIPGFIEMARASSEVLGSENISLNETGSNASEVMNLQGIWSVTLKDSEQVLMVLNQFGPKLFGSAKNEEAGWNSVVMGTIGGEMVDLTMIYLQGGKPVSLTLTGDVSNESATGRFFRADSQGQIDSGPFSAIMINPDSTAYTPTEEAEEVRWVQTAKNETAEVKGDTTVAGRSAEQKRYTDVHDLAHLVPPAAGVIPPGMGMFGGGGGASMS